MTLLIVPAALAFYTGEISSYKRRAVIYQISMSLAVLLFFSIASVKRDDYILPAIPGIAILCASVFALEVRGGAAKLRDVIVAVCVFSPILLFLLYRIVPGYGGHASLQSSDAAYYSTFHEYAKAGVSGLYVTGILWLFALGTAVFALIRRSAILSGLAFGVFAVSGSLLWTATLRPAVAAARSVKSFVPVIAEHVKGDQLCIASGLNYELSYYYGAAVPDLADPRCATVAAGKPVYLIATPRELDAMTPEYRAQLKLVAKSDLIGGGGPPSLFEISPGAAR
jgi:hypothetical protein